MAPYGGLVVAESADEALRNDLDQSGVKWAVLGDSLRKEAETAWRRVYGHAFLGRPRLRHGVRAEHEYLQQRCDHYYIVPFSTGVPGLPVHVLGQAIAAYECHGPLIDLGLFCNAEFFVAPPDFTWTMVHTHENHGFGGPYFIRVDWIL